MSNAHSVKPSPVVSSYQSRLERDTHSSAIYEPQSDSDEDDFALDIQRSKQRR